MIRETLTPAQAISDDDVTNAVAALSGVGPMLIAVGVLTERAVVLRALPLQLEITVGLGTTSLNGDERLGKVTGAATAEDFTIYVPDPEPYTAQVNEAVAGQVALVAGKAPAEPAATATVSIAKIDADALRRITGGAR